MTIICIHVLISKGYSISEYMYCITNAQFIVYTHNKNISDGQYYWWLIEISEISEILF